VEVNNEGVQFCHLLAQVVLQIYHVSLARCPAFISSWLSSLHRRGLGLSRGGIRDCEAFSGHEMRGPAGTGRGGVSMAGGRQGPMQREGGRGTTEGPSLAITVMLFSSID